MKKHKCFFEDKSGSIRTGVTMSNGLPLPISSTIDFERCKICGKIKNLFMPEFRED